VRERIELDLDCGLLVFEDGEWRLRTNTHTFHAAPPRRPPAPPSPPPPRRLLLILVGL
jgi:hypothetical protein